MKKIFEWCMDQFFGGFCASVFLFGADRYYFMHDLVWDYRLYYLAPVVSLLMGLVITFIAMLSNKLSQSNSNDIT